MSSIPTIPTISILSYNILSQNLAEQMINEIKDDKEVYNISYMNEKSRWSQISKLIETQINNSRNKKINESDYLIFCLQEVVEQWIPNIAQLFNSLDYTYINIHHGRVFNGNMGVLIAFPKFFSIIKSEFYTVGQHIMVIDDNSKIAAGKTNTAILLLLENQSINLKFGVITYHMPLEPKIPHISMSHAKVLMKKIGKFMENNIWFYGGDFNITPDSKTYQYLASINNCIWLNLQLYPITNHAYIRGYEFSGCLDYIFYSKQSLRNIECIDVQYEIITTIIPNNKHPSDHIPIYAKFKIL